MINSVTICGNLTRDAELRATGNGLQILSFTVAVNDRRRNAQGQWEDVPNYVPCTLFGERAEKLAGYLVKGVKVCVTGKLHYQSWQAKDGTKRHELEVNVSDLDFMQRREPQAEQQPQQPQLPQQMPYYPQQPQQQTPYYPQQ